MLGRCDAINLRQWAADPEGTSMKMIFPKTKNQAWRTLINLKKIKKGKKEKR